MRLLITSATGFSGWHTTARRLPVGAVAATIPMGRLGTPQDIRAAVIWLASNEASGVTGQTIGVNGGSFGN